MVGGDLLDKDLKGIRVHKMNGGQGGVHVRAPGRHVESV